MRKLIEQLEGVVDEQVPPQFQKGPRKGDKTDKKGFDKPGDDKAGSDQVIKALRDTDYRDKDAFFKMVQLLKGLAVNSEKDETAKKFMSAVSDALTTAAKSVLGEDVLDERELKPKKVHTRRESHLKQWRMSLDRIEGALKSGDGALKKMERIGGATMHEAILMRAARDMAGEAAALVKNIERD